MICFILESESEDADGNLLAAAPAYADAWKLVPKDIKDRIFDTLHSEGWQEKAIEIAERGNT
jgi:uncharacterized protein YciW